MQGSRGWANAVKDCVLVNYSTLFSSLSLLRACEGLNINVDSQRMITWKLHLHLWLIHFWWILVAMNIVSSVGLGDIWFDWLFVLNATSPFAPSVTARRINCGRFCNRFYYLYFPPGKPNGILNFEVAWWKTWMLIYVNNANNDSRISEIR